MKNFWIKLKLFWAYGFRMDFFNETSLAIIFKFIMALDSQDFKKSYRNYRNTKVGKKVLERDTALIDRIRTDNFEPGTFGAEFQTWLRDSDGAVDVFSVEYPGAKKSSKLGKFFKETTMQHDLIHFLNGYDTTPAGEVCVLTFDLTKEWRDSYATILFTFCRLVIESWRRGKRAPWLMFVDWDKYLNVDLQQVKKELLLDNEPKYWSEVGPIYNKARNHYHGIATNRP
jgi:ubiquinone biosynthesis protein Coq4